MISRARVGGRKNSKANSRVRVQFRRAAVERELTSGRAALIRNFVILISCFLRELEVRVVSSQKSPKD